MTQMIFSIIGAAILGIGGLVVGRFSVKSKLQIKVEKQEHRLCDVEKTQPLVVEGMFILLQSAKKKGEINGESDGLMRRFEDHLFNRKG